MSCRQHGYPWPSHASSPYHSSLLAGFQGYIPYPHIAAVCMFELVVLLLLSHMRGSIGVHHWWVRLCFSTSVLCDTRLTKAWTAIDRLSIIWNSDLTDKMKRSFFQAAVLSILLYGCTTWTLTKRLKKKLDGNYTRMLRAILNKSWRQHPQGTNYTATCLPSRKLYKLDEPDTKN